MVDLMLGVSVEQKKKSKCQKVVSYQKVLKIQGAGMGKSDKYDM